MDEKFFTPSSFTFDAPTDVTTKNAFFFEPPTEIAFERREMSLRKRERVEDRDVIIPAAKRFCPSKPVKGGFRGNVMKRARGPGQSKKIEDTLLTLNFGVKHWRVIGISHAVPKAILLGKMDTDIKTMKDGEEKEKLRKELYNLTRRKTSSTTREANQLRRAKEFLKDLNMDQDQEEHDLDDIENISKLMPDYQFIVWWIEGKQFVASEAARFNTEGTKFIGLFYHRRHVEYVTHIVGPRSARFCYKCFKFGDSNHPKNCEATCKRCGTANCMPGYAKIHCDTCNIDFRSQKCFDSHKISTSGHALPFCKKYLLCKSCLAIVRTDNYSKRTHKCGKNTHMFPRDPDGKKSPLPL